MKILIINCHSDNRGDEAAVHSMVDEIVAIYPKCKITLAIRGVGTNYPNMPENVTMINQFNPASLKSSILLKIADMTRGNIVLLSRLKELVDEINTSDIILHAPGGPSIGDTYFDDEPTYLRIYDLIRHMKKPYMFYAPSMGPFEIVSRNRWRKRIIGNAKAIVLRDPISAEYVKKLLPEKKVQLTLDSALQHEIDKNSNQIKFEQFTELKEFLCSHEKCVGITITDLMWHPVHSKKKNIQEIIRNSFNRELSRLSSQGYGMVFIPQLYGNGNDYELMKSYCCNAKDYFILPADDTRYDAYFQQYVIGKLYAVIGMRYHSNIFSAKMGTPFISVSYEQKMQGFMEKINLQKYCIKLDELSDELLNSKFQELVVNYNEYKHSLELIHDSMRNTSYRTTEIFSEIIRNEVL